MSRKQPTFYIPQPPPDHMMQVHRADGRLTVACSCGWQAGAFNQLDAGEKFDNHRRTAG